MGFDSLRICLILFVELLIVSVNLAAFYKDIKFLCLDCSCDPKQLLTLEVHNDLQIENLEVRCEENPTNPLKQSNKRKQFLVEADTEVSPEREIISVDLYMDDLNLTSLSILNHFAGPAYTALFRKISLKSNLIENIANFSSNLDTIKILDLSKNQITLLEGGALRGLTDLRDLNLSHNALRSLDLNALEQCPLVERVDLSRNKINQVHCKALELRYIKNLDLSSNFIFGSTICSNSSFPELIHLNLSRNQIDEVSEITFVGMSQLQVLDLSENRLVSFHPLQDLNSLVVLFLESNRIRNISAELFNLFKLSLGHNEIETLDELVAVNLAVLNVSDNRLKSLETVLNVSSKIEDLDASWNHIKTVNWSVVYDALKKLSLDGNPLLANGLNFSGLRSLKSLSLNHIPTLETFDTSCLGAMFEDKQTNECTVFNMAHNQELKKIIGTLSDKNLCQIDLSYNQLTSLKQSMFNWGKIKSVDFQGNPLDCRCSLKWMVDFLVPFLLDKSSHLLTNLSCETPEDYKDRRLVHWYKRNDFCNFSSDSRIVSGVAEGFGTAEPGIDIQSANVISDHKMLIAVTLVTAIIVVMIAIGCVLMKKRKTKRRKEHMKRNRRYPNNNYAL